MPRRGEVISLHVGQAGCLLGDQCWEMFCLEHGIQPDGTMISRFDRSHPETFFKVTEKETMVPRAAFIDLEPSVVQSIQRGKNQKLYDPQFIVTSMEDAGNCFARGYITQAKKTIEPIFQTIATLANDCDRLQGFLMFRAYGGGTGSGLGSRILQRLYEEYPKLNVFEFGIYPASKRSSIIPEPYNGGLTTNESMGHTTGSFIIEKEACYDIHDRLIGVPPPSLSSINYIISYVVSNVTASLRFDGTLNIDFDELTTNLFPFPRLQYPVVSYAPYLSRDQVSYRTFTTSSILNECFQPYSQLVKCDTKAGKFMACTVLFRGDVTNSSIVEATPSLKNNKQFNFVDWCPNAFKIGIIDVPPVAIPNGDIAEVDKACMVLVNNTAIRSAWLRVKQNFDLIYSKKSFLHWYLMEGMEESDFEAAKHDLASLCEDYEKAGESS